MNNLKILIKNYANAPGIKQKQEILSVIENIHTPEHASYNIPQPPAQVLSDMRAEYARMLYVKEIEAAKLALSQGEIDFYKLAAYSVRSKLEMQLSHHFISPKNGSVAIVGSGPMPVTGLSFAGAGYDV